MPIHRVELQNKQLKFAGPRIDEADKPSRLSDSAKAPVQQHFVQPNGTLQADDTLGIDRCWFCEKVPVRTHDFVLARDGWFRSLCDKHCATAASSDYKQYAMSLCDQCRPTQADHLDPEFTIVPVDLDYFITFERTNYETRNKALQATGQLQQRDYPTSLEYERHVEEMGLLGKTQDKGGSYDRYVLDYSMAEWCDPADFRPGKWQGGPRQWSGPPIAAVTRALSVLKIMEELWTSKRVGRQLRTLQALYVRDPVKVTSERMLRISEGTVLSPLTLLMSIPTIIASPSTTASDNGTASSATMDSNATPPRSQIMNDLQLPRATTPDHRFHLAHILQPTVESVSEQPMLVVDATESSPCEPHEDTNRRRAGTESQGDGPEYMNPEYPFEGSRRRDKGERRQVTESGHSTFAGPEPLDLYGPLQQQSHYPGGIRFIMNASNFDNSYPNKRQRLETIDPS